jgi:molybdopterin molybdotransferase
MISFEQALNTVKEKLAAAEISPGTEVAPLAAAAGRVLAEDIAADRDYPPFHRATRDGFAVRAADVGVPPVVLRLRGEVRAGGHFPGALGAGDCVSIMTGAPLPPGADAIVMVEYAETRGDGVEIQRAVHPAENVVYQGSEAPSGVRVLSRGKRLGAGEVGLLASVGKSRVSVFARPRVAILATGDEVVPVEQRPEWFQIRNSNAFALSAQVAAAGGIPQPLGIAPDRLETLRAMIEEGLGADLLLLSGGVSVGKFDFVAQALAGLGAEFYIQGVALQPGKPLVFGRAAGTFFFGLPGNPVSTFVTFELFARPAIAALGGATYEAVVFLRARLAQPLEAKAGLTAFLPGRLACPSGDPVVSPVGWQGSGDLVGVAAADCFLIVHPDQTRLEAGDWVDVMPKGQ